ncbi:ankyrin repeat domain-containing protein [Dyella monticola]|uniref:Ankyrin repeat domain-containing protein n=1 Tax=Dyella monticola TaxID=1927958 RepID=A0A370WZY6_9GAMM|nr:ankyrin repeat domain-containing protein [Dyella monticola]RDS81600.1 ankyrin repeat domain-containing protein [Dyella monticola]
MEHITKCSRDPNSNILSSNKRLVTSVLSCLMLMMTAAFVYASSQEAKTEILRPVASSIARPPISSDLTPQQALVIAIDHNDLTGVTTALKAGADPNAVTNNSTPVMDAAFSGYVEITKILLAHGADVNFANIYGVTPLLAAAGTGQADTVTLLIQGGATIESRDWKGNTPLLSAAESGSVETVKVLLAHNAAVNARNRDGDSALDIAKHDISDPYRTAFANGYKEILQILSVGDCTKLNCTAVKNPPIGPVKPPVDPNAPHVTPPSLVECDYNATPAMGDAEYAFPADMPPVSGSPIRVTLNTPIVAQVRVLAMNNGNVIGIQKGAGVNQLLTTYSGTEFRFRPELCVNGLWRPITSRMAVTESGYMWTTSANPNPTDDFFTLAAAGETFQPTASNIGLTLEVRFPIPQVKVSVTAEHNCHNYWVAAEVTNYGKVSISTPQGAYPAKIVSVEMVYDGNFIAGNDNPWDPSNPTRLNAFPYSSPISSTLKNQSYAVVSDQNRSAGFGVSICGGFVVNAAVELGDGRKYYGHVHAG